MPLQLLVYLDIMKLIKLFFCLFLFNSSFAQWVERDYIYLGSCNPGGAISGGFSNDIVLLNDSTGYRIVGGTHSPSNSFRSYRTICNYGNSPFSGAPSPEWSCGAGYQINYPAQYMSGPTSYQLLNFDTLFYYEYEYILNRYYLRRSFDSGATDSLLFSTDWSSPAMINDYYFLNNNVGFINLSDTTTDLLIEYNNGTVDTVLISSNSLSSKIQFINDSVGFMQKNDLILNKKRLVRSVDIGQNWTNVFDSLPSDLKNIDFVSDSIGFITLINDSIFKTLDKGISWNFVSIDYNRFHGIYDFVTKDLWYAVANSDSLFKSYNQGQNWIYDSLFVTNLQDIEIRSDSIGYATGTDCKLYTKGKNGNQSTGLNESNTKFKSISVYPNPANNKLNLKHTSNNNPSLIQIVDINGKLLIEKYYVNEIDISIIPSGLYFIKIQLDSTISHHKFIKE